MTTTKRINQLNAGTAFNDTSYIADEDTTNSNITQKLSALQFNTYLLTKFAATPLLLNSGGTSAALTASNGGVIYSTASALAVLPGTNAANRILASGINSAPSWTTAIYPATTTANQILYSLSNNEITGLTTAANGALVTSSGGVPSISSTLPTAVQTNITQVGVVTSGVWQGTAVGVSSGGTGLISTPSNGVVDIGNGSGFTRTTLTAGAGVSISNGAGSITISASSESANPQGFVYGLAEIWQTTKTISKLQGNIAVPNGSGYTNLVYSNAITLDITTSGANGLDTGTVAANTAYWIWAIGDSTGSHSPAYVFSLASAFNLVTLPTGYNIGRICGWVKTAIGATDLLQYNFSGLGNERQYDWVDTTYTFTDLRLVNSTASSGSNISTAPVRPAYISTTPPAPLSTLKLLLSFVSTVPGDRVQVQAQQTPFSLRECVAQENGVANTSFLTITSPITGVDANQIAFVVSGVGSYTTSIFGIGFTLYI